jgi:hypothetical protein
VDSKDRVGEGAAWTQRGAWLGSKTGRGGQPTQYNGLCATPVVAQHMLSIDSSSHGGKFTHPLLILTYPIPPSGHAYFSPSFLQKLIELLVARKKSWAGGGTRKHQ